MQNGVNRNYSKCMFSYISLNYYFKHDHLVDNIYVFEIIKLLNIVIFFLIYFYIYLLFIIILERIKFIKSS